MTPIEIIALIAAILIIIKSLIWAAKPKWVINLAEKFFKAPAVPVLGYLALSLIIGYYVIQELTIIQIVAVLLMSAYLIKMVMSMYAKETLNYAKQVYRKTNWFVVIMLLAIAAAVLWKLFA